MMPDGGGAATSSHQEATGNIGSPLSTFSMSQPLDSQAKPGTVAGDHRPQGVNFPFLPHSLIGRILPREPEPSPPPTAFHVPVPRGLPSGPRLSQEFTTSTTDSDNQNTSLQGNSQRKPWHEQGNGVSTDRGGALFSIVKRNPCSPGRGQRSKASNDRVGYQKGTTGSTNGSEIHGSRFSNRTINNESSANYDCTNKMHAMRKQRYECLQSFTLQNRQRQATWRTQPNAQRSPLLDSTDKLRVKRDWFAVTKKKYEKRNLEAQKSNADEVKIDCSLQNGFSNDTDQNDRCLQEQTEEHVDRDKIMPAADIRSNVDESLVDFATDVVEGNSSKAEVRNKKEMEDFSFEICSTTEVEVLAQEFADSFMLKDQHFNNNACAGFDSVGRSQVSCSSRRIFGSSIQCRPDIENLTPGFLSFFRSLVLPAEQAKGYQNILLHSLAMLVREEWPNVELHLYGSCANSFSLPSSDIDVCLSFDDTNVNKLQILFKLEKKLRSKNFQDVETLASARVPIVKMIDPESGISCDFCINNHLAVANTKLLRDYAMIDKRLQQLVFIVKHWAKSRGVNATFQGTLSSYAYVLMCIHFLQLRKPAILPCLQKMEATYLLTVDDIECAFFDNVETLRGFGSRNHESLAQLVWEFFHYWAYIHDYENHVISVRTGRIISKESKNWSKRSGNCRHLLCIEDPFETSHDLGRPVNMHTINILREEFKRAAVILQHDPYPLQNLFF